MNGGYTLIYASDLDRTLIYSQSFLDSHPTDVEITLVDKSKTNSFMTNKVIDELQALCRKPGILFVPVTNRSIDEYRRINIPGIKPRYSITTSGGHIFKGDKFINEWEEYLDSLIDVNRLYEIVNTIQSMESVKYDPRIVDGRYVFSKSSDRERTKEELIELRKQNTDFVFYLEKSKIYAIPKCFNKGKALKWLAAYLGEKLILASGDGELDVSMMEIADIALVPEHHNIKNMESIASHSLLATGYVESPLSTFEVVRKIS